MMCSAAALYTSCRRLCLTLPLQPSLQLLASGSPRSGTLPKIVFLLRTALKFLRKSKPIPMYIFLRRGNGTSTGYTASTYYFVTIEYILFITTVTFPR